MKYRILLLAGLLLTVSTLHAQPFRIAEDTVTAQGPSGDIIAPKTVVINENSTDTLEFYWKRGASKQPEQWQNQGVCDKNACYTGTDSATFKLAPNDTGQLKINFYAYDENFNGVNGSGELLVRVGLTGNQFPDAEEQTTYFSASTFSTGFDDGQSASELRTYPNPVNNQLNLRFQKPGSHTVRLFNVLGKSVMEKEIRSQEGSVNMASLNDGIYILRVKGNNGAKTTKRIYKR
jgi:hypothetical protein